MGIPDPVRETYLINVAHARGSGLIEAFSTHQPTERAAILARVGAVLDEYCGSLRDDLQHAVGTVDASEAAWLRQHYLRLIVEFATSLRDSITDRTSRHAAAQVIQCKVLEHERNLRIVIDPHADLASTDAAASHAVKVVPE
jgi:hypothetical protein